MADWFGERVNNMKIKRISVFLIISVMLQTACLAENAITIEAKRGMVDVCVNSDEENAYKDVSLEMSGPFSEIVDLEDINSLIENIGVGSTNALTKTVFNEKKTDGEGNLTYTFYPLSDNKFYIVSVNIEGGESVHRELILNVSDSLEGTIVNALNAAANADEVKGVFDNTEYHNAIVYKHKIFRDIKNESNRKNVYEALYNAKEAEPFTSLSGSFESTLKTVSAYQVVSESDSAAKAKQTADEYISFAFNDSDENDYFYKRYSEFSAAEKETVFGRLLGCSLPNSAAWRLEFEKSVFLSCVQKESYANNLYSFINKYAAKFGVNMYSYGQNVSTVNNAIYKKYYGSISAFSEAIRLACGNITPTPGGGGTGGGGGTSGGSGGNIYAGNTGTSTNIRPTQPRGAANEIFSDLNSVQWAKAAIRRLYEKGVVSGDGSGNFYPNSPVTREEFLKMLLVSLGKVDKNASHSFTDSTKADWNYSYIASGVKLGIVNGLGGGLFGVGKPITRQDMAVMVFRAAELKGSEDKADFKDDREIADYAKEAVYALKQSKIINGNDEGNFQPQKNATRAEAAMIINALIKE